VSVLVRVARAGHRSRTSAAGGDDEEIRDGAAASAAPAIGPYPEKRDRRSGATVSAQNSSVCGRIVIERHRGVIGTQRPVRSGVGAATGSARWRSCLAHMH